MKLINIKRIFYIIFLLVIVYFLTNTCYQNYTKILEFEFKISVFYILFSLILIFGVFCYWAILWKYLIKKKDISYQNIFYIYAISWLAKYIPGKAGIVLSKIYFLTKHGVSKKQGLVASIYENIFIILSAFFVSIPLILYYFTGGLSDYYLYLSIIFILGFLVFIYPPVFYFLINFGLKLFKKDILEKEYFLNKKEIIKNLFLFSIGIFLNGVAFWGMIKGITDISWELLLPMVGVWNFASVIGLLAIFAPAGVGVREGILILFLQYYFPLEIATLISVFSRFWTTLLDGLVGLSVLFFKSKK